LDDQRLVALLHERIDRSLWLNCGFEARGNSATYQSHVWPFYMVTGVGDDGRLVTLFIPAEW
jgi:hypothetical protein